MVVPTMPRFYTVAEVEADPVRLNSRLGTYTNFVNLLDLCAIAVPAGVRGDGLPSSVTLIGPAGADGLLAGLAAAIQARSGAPTKAAAPAASPAPQAASSAPGERIEIAVFGAHLSGLPLNREFVDLGASFSREVETTPDYRLFALPGSAPAKPGLLRVAEGAGLCDQGRDLDARPRRLRRLCRQDPARSGSARSGFKDGGSVQGISG